MGKSSFHKYPGQGFWARAGDMAGKSLAEAIPKETSRLRLSEGLTDLANNKENLSPEQYLAKVASIPGALDNPQLIQSFGELARQRQKGEGLKKVGESNRNAFENVKKSSEKSLPGKSITTTTPIEATTKPYIRRTNEENLARASELYDQNPQLYPNPQDAISAAYQEDQQNAAINSDLQAQRRGEQDVQSKVEQELATQAKNLGVELPGNVLSDIQDKAIDDVRTGKRTEKEAAKFYGKELDGISRDYKALESVGNWKLLTASPEGNKKTLRSIRDGFKERGDLENYADSLVGINKLSPSKAAYLAYPVSDNKEVNNIIHGLPNITPKASMLEKGHVNEKDREKRNFSTFEKLAPLLQKSEASPLAIKEELNAKGYDGNGWLDYVTKHRKSLNLNERQGRELDKPRNNASSIDDIWMFTWSGLDKLLEQE